MTTSLYQRISAFSIFIFVNLLFVYKYGFRQDYVSNYILLTVYGILLIATITLFNNAKNRTSLILKPNLVYKLTSLFAVTGFLLLIIFINGEQLNVDRWAAIEITVEGFLEWEYPYIRKDYAGNMSSNLPGLGILALPFYLIGDVGFFQLAIFILFAIHLYRSSTDKKVAAAVLILYVLSSALWWEVAVKSDLVSNIMLVILFIDWWFQRYKEDIFQKPIYLGLCIAVFIMTRVVIVIPLILFFFKPFLKSKTSIKVLFLLSVLFGTAIICLPFILVAPDWNTIKTFNPLILQGNKAPVISYLFLILPFIIPFIKKRSASYFLFSMYLIFSIPFISFCFKLTQHGWYAVIFNHLSDISYLSMCFPPFFIWLKYQWDKQAFHSSNLST